MPQRPRFLGLLRAPAALPSADPRPGASGAGPDDGAEAAAEAMPPELTESGVRTLEEPLPDRILRVATGLFAERGYRATSLREVASAAGCTKPAVYYHFRNKEELFLACLRAEAATLTGILDLGLEQHGTVRDRLVRGIEALCRHCRLRPAGLALLERAEWLPDEGQPGFDFSSVRSLHLGLARGLLEEGIARGELRGDLPVEEAVFALAGLVHQRTERFLRDGEPIPVAFPERAVDVLFRGFADSSRPASDPDAASDADPEDSRR